MFLRYSKLLILIQRNNNLGKFVQIVYKFFFFFQEIVKFSRKVDIEFRGRVFVLYVLGLIFNLEKESIQLLIGGFWCGVLIIGRDKKNFVKIVIFSESLVKFKYIWKEISNIIQEVKKWGNNNKYLGKELIFLVVKLFEVFSF